MQFKSKFFDELSTRELYEIIKARMEIFVVEQTCNYQDLDDVDFKALHIFFEDENGRVAAYLRAFRLDDDAKTVRIGRVLTIEHGKGLGGKLLSQALEAIKEKLKPEKIYVESQCHAIGFYEREGFKICTEEFLDVGIPHKGMELFV
jgi:ElaA protein